MKIHIKLQRTLALLLSISQDLSPLVFSAPLHALRPSSFSESASLTPIIYDGHVGGSRPAIQVGEEASRGHQGEINQSNAVKTDFSATIKPLTTAAESAQSLGPEDLTLQNAKNRHLQTVNVPYASATSETTTKAGSKSMSAFVVETLIFFRNLATGVEETWPAQCAHRIHYMKKNTELRKLNIKDVFPDWHKVIPDSDTYKPPGLQDFVTTTFIKPDGNCQFRAISLMVKGRQEDYAEFRSRAVEHLRKNQESYKPFFVPTRQDKSYAAYCHRMSKDGEFGDQFILQALADANSYKIIVLSDGDSHESLAIIKLEPEKSRHEDPYLPLYLNEEHYEVLLKDGPSKADPGSANRLENEGEATKTASISDPEDTDSVRDSGKSAEHGDALLKGAANSYPEINKSDRNFPEPENMSKIGNFGIWQSFTKFFQLLLRTLRMIYPAPWSFIKFQ